MKEATGELGTTVLVIIAIIAVIGVMTYVIPRMGNWVNDSFTETTTKGKSIPTH